MEAASEMEIVEVKDVQPIAGKLVTGHGLTVLVVVRPGEALLTHTAVHSLQLRVLIWIAKFLAVVIYIIIKRKQLRLSNVTNTFGTINSFRISKYQIWPYFSLGPNNIWLYYVWKFGFNIFLDISSKKHILKLH